MIDPTKAEIVAVEMGGRAGGQYLDAIDKFDLRTLNKEEWQQFLLCTIGGYHDQLHRLQAEESA